MDGLIALLHQPGPRAAAMVIAAIGLGLELQGLRTLLGLPPDQRAKLPRDVAILFVAGSVLFSLAVTAVAIGFT